jgi:hypothetical protein
MQRPPALRRTSGLVHTVPAGIHFNPALYPSWREKRKIQANYTREPKESTHSKSMWSTDSYYNKPLDWRKQESNYERKMKIVKAKKEKV